jgi:hypothetical protein
VSLAPIVDFLLIICFSSYSLINSVIRVLLESSHESNLVPDITTITTLIV